MATTAPALHIAFNPSFAGSLQHALTAAGRDDRVVRLLDDFSFGPIDCDDASARAAWVEQELGYTEWLDVAARNADLLDATHTARGPIIAWYSDDSAQIASGFLWWLSHIRDTPCRIVRAPGLGRLRSEEIAALLRRDVPLSGEERNAGHARWAQLKREDAPLRVIEDGTLVSAPLIHFDAALMAQTSIEWRKMALIVGNTLRELWETGVDQVGDLILAARLATLAEEGALEWRGDLSALTTCEMRLPPGQV